MLRTADPSPGDGVSGAPDAVAPRGGRRTKKRRTLPWATSTRCVTPQHHKDGWEAPEGMAVEEHAAFCAAMANLESCDASVVVECVQRDDEIATGDDVTIEWGDTTELHRRAFGRALGYRQGDVAWDFAPTYEAERHTPQQWHDLFHQRTGWSIEMESDECEDDEGRVRHTQRVMLCRDEAACP